MKRLLLFAAVAGLGLVSASPPDHDRGRGPGAGDGAYPPCSRTVRDRCIQRERGHRDAAHHRRHHAHDGHARHDEHARHDGARAHRRGHGSHVRMASRCAARCAAPRRAVAARVRRAGERG